MVKLVSAKSSLKESSTKIPRTFITNKVIGAIFRSFIHVFNHLRNRIRLLHNLFEITINTAFQIR